MKKLSLFILAFFIITLISFYFQSNAESINQSLWLKEFTVLGESFKLVDILFVSIVSFISVMIILLLIILLNRAKMEREKRIKDNLLVKYQDLLLKYLEKEDNVNESLEFIKLASSRFKRQLLITEISDLALNLPEKPLQKIQKLYFDLKLDRDTFRKLRGPWYKKIQGIKELYALNIAKKNKSLYKWVNSKNDLLRMEAQIALVDLSKEHPESNPFEFLGKLKLPFSLWEQITLHQVMVQRDIQIPDFSQWLDSKNDTVVMFCLRMIKEYKQTENYQKIQMATSHKNENVRRLAYQVLGDLKLASSLKQIRGAFKTETHDNRVEIIRGMRKASDLSLIPFLRKVIDNEESAEILVEAVRAIADTGEAGKEILNKMLQSEYKDYNIIIKHVLDHRII